MVYNDSYYEMVRWVKLFKLVENRIDIVNQLSGCRTRRENVASLSYSRGRYVVNYCRCELAAFRVYDLPSLQVAFDACDSLAESLWPVKVL